MAQVTISRTKLHTFLQCQRRFQLRYIHEQAWPEPPLTEEEEARLARGKQFHQLAERHLLGLPPEPIQHPTIDAWWQGWLSWVKGLPNGRFLPEFTLTIPIQGVLLRGRFDLVLLANDNSIHIFDWKTGHAPPRATLRQDWQTRFYLGMMAESGTAVQPQQPPQPTQIKLTYWYTNAPAQTFSYNQQWHQQNWSELQTYLQSVVLRLEDEENWPLTDDSTLCQTCPYQILCGRQQTDPPPPPDPFASAEEDDSWQMTSLMLEPNLP